MVTFRFAEDNIPQISISMFAAVACPTVNSDNGTKRRVEISLGIVESGCPRRHGETACSNATAVAALNRSSLHGRLPVISDMATCGELLKNIARVLSVMNVQTASLRDLLVKVDQKEAPGLATLTVPHPR